MRVLRAGQQGDDVLRWQLFLTGLGHSPGTADGIFGGRTVTATRAFQTEHALTPDGAVGPKTLAEALRLGFDAGIVDDAPAAEETSVNWPPRPSFPALTTTAAREAVFGKFTFKPTPTAMNLEAIAIEPAWVAENIRTVEVPQLAALTPGGKVTIHKAIEPQFRSLWAAWETAGLLPLIKSWAGAWVPRFIRGSRTVLSNHAFGSAFDINARWNGLGVVPPVVGAPGSVRELVPLANAHGFYWGGHFTRTDGMHFEAAFILPAPVASVQRTPTAPGDRRGGREIVDSCKDLSVARREDIWLDELRAGNLPSISQSRTTIELSALIDGAIVEATLAVADDYVAIGTDDDFVRVPFSRPGAEEAARILGGLLPTTRLVDAIHAQAATKLAPSPKTPGPQMMGVPYILEHQAAIEATRPANGAGLTAGHKKDVVLTNRLRAQPRQVPIYGWHRKNGTPIQPLSLIHELTYADYSHGVRVVAPTLTLDGREISTRDALADRRLAPLLSSEGAIVG